MRAMTAAMARWGAGLAMVAVLAGACGSTVSPAPPATPTPVGQTASPAPTPSATPEPVRFPLAVVTSFTDLRESVTPDVIEKAVSAGTAVIPCGLVSLQLGDALLPLPLPDRCVAMDQVVGRVRAANGSLGLVAPGLVTPAVKVLRIGDADLFGSPVRRAEAYPLVAISPGIDPNFIVYDARDVRTMVTPIDWCPDRGVAQAVARAGKGWDWILQGGMVRYTGTHLDTTFSGRSGLGGWPVVDAVAAGDAGAMLRFLKDADLTLVDIRCPIVNDYHAGTGTTTVFSLSPITTKLLQDASVDVVALASNHIYDHGRAGLSQTLQLLDAAGIPHTGAGLTLGQALKPVVLDVSGVRFGFVAFDSTIGSPRATATTPGVAGLTTANLQNAIGQARESSDVVVALPVWNWPEYWAHFTKQTLAQRDEMFGLGVSVILGDGNHWAAGLSLDQGPDGPRLAVASHGNFLFDQGWSRETQETMVYELTFYGTRLAQVRLHPTFLLAHGQPGLVNPQTDGAFVMKQVFENSTFDLP